MSVTARLMRALRSRKLAIGLLLVVVVVSIIATLVPQGGASEPQVARWASAHPVAEWLVLALGLHQTFTSPLFLLVVLVLGLSTGVCAAERTTVARRAAGSSAGLGDPDVARLRRRADLVAELPAGTDPREALAAVGRVADANGMGARSGPRALEATSRRWGVWGSPLFHWSLTLLMLVFVAGYATRAEGLIDLRIDQPVRDAPDAYRSLTVGPLFGGRYTGLEITASDLAQSLVIDGVQRGPAPFVTLQRGETMVKAQRVFPNSPLRYGNLTIHMDGLSLALAMSIEDSSGVSIGRVPFGVQYSAGQSGATGPVQLTLVDSQQRPIMDARVVVMLSAKTSGRPTQAPDLIPAIVETSTPDSGQWGQPVTLKLGQAIPLPGAGGDWMRFVTLDDAVTLRVANDWSVPYVYVLFGFAVVGLGIALLALPRRIVAVIDEGEQGIVLRMVVETRREPAFRRAVVQAVAVALDSPQEAGQKAGLDA